MSIFHKIENGIVVQSIIADSIFINSKAGNPSQWIEDKPLQRKNQAGIGFTYDKNSDCFIPPKIFNSWILNNQTKRYDPPVSHPNDGKLYYWNEVSKTWNLSI